ncbi:MAG: cobalamin synthesis protein P47K [Desulfatiglans sp.]|nr:cobalamin synthesis protein P47K [Desulfatiglans sp.]
MKKTKLILVGGFLGAGKTTLLWEAAQTLSRKGLRVGLITNDQAPGLVDTAFLSRGTVNVAEVNGSCFCCNFQGLMDAMSRVSADHQADILIAEPVGSCTDLSATIIQPLKKLLGQEITVCPLSVMADPARLKDILDGGTSGLHPSAAYIYRKQVEEADIIVISKVDLMSQAEIDVLKDRFEKLFSGKPVLAISAKTGEGMDKWLDVVTTTSAAGQYLADVDYDIYAEGEAVLGWLNATILLEGKPTKWRGFAEQFLKTLGEKCELRSAPVGHIKLIIEAEDSFVMGNITGKQSALSIQGAEMTTARARLTINVRVQMPPDTLNDIINETLASVVSDQLTMNIGAWRCLSPGRPNPTHRYNHIITA